MSDPHATDPAHRGEEVFEILAREHAGMLVSFLRSLVRAPDAVDDLFQETMLTAWRRLGDYDRSRAFGPWLRGIAHNKVRKYRERAAREAVVCDPEVLEALDARFATAARPEEFQHTTQRLLACLQRLPEAMQAVIRMVYERGLRLGQVAIEVGSSEEAVKKRVQRGRKLLADCLRTGGTS